MVQRCSFVPTVETDGVYFRLHVFDYYIMQTRTVSYTGEPSKLVEKPGYRSARVKRELAKVHGLRNP